MTLTVRGARRSVKETQNTLLHSPHAGYTGPAKATLNSNTEFFFWKGKIGTVAFFHRWELPIQMTS